MKTLIKISEFLRDTRPWSTMGFLMIGIYGAAFILIVGSMRSPTTSAVMAHYVPEHFRVVVESKTAHGFVATNIDGSRFVTARYTVEPYTNQLFSTGDTLDSYFELGEIHLSRKVGKAVLPIRYLSRDRVRIRN